MTDPAAPAVPVPDSDDPSGVPVKLCAAALGTALLLAGCATQPGRQSTFNTRFDPRLGVSSSERVVADGEPVPRGGGSYLVGRPYTIAGRAYYPAQRPDGYSVVGTASWYGDAFHGRRTANGEVFDKGSISAAHPTLPLPSYVRVTNLGNGRSMIVRVNDRGPYHGGRVMDVSQRVAETLDFRRAGTARIRVDYVGRASLRGDDDEKLVATLRTDGVPAAIAGLADAPQLAAASPAVPAEPAPPRPQPARVARLARPDEPSAAGDASIEPMGRLARAPLPPTRPFEASSLSPTSALSPSTSRAKRRADRIAALLQR